MLPEGIFSELEVVFFDAEGTLFHIHPSVGAIYARVCRRYGLAVEPEEMERRFREVFARLKDQGELSPEGCWRRWRQIFLETVSSFGELKDPHQAFAECYRAFTLPENFLLSPGTREVLRSLREQGKRVAIISNWDERLRKLVASFGLEDFFAEIVISCEVGLAKPNPEIYHLACQRLETPPEKALMIGDHPEDDVLAARKAGLWALRYPGGDLRRLFPRK
ncbi:MAG: HAD-IA family hydrolase [Thermodesulfobacteria bacterium]|nr:HAD-IA family hydrolase [Thermodesulfobacteriota bacterium]